MPAHKAPPKVTGRPVAGPPLLKRSKGKGTAPQVVS